MIARADFLVHYDKELKEANYLDQKDTPAWFLLADEVTWDDDFTVTGVKHTGPIIEVSATRRSAPEQGAVTLVFDHTPIKLLGWWLVDLLRSQNSGPAAKPAVGNSNRFRDVSVPTGPTINTPLSEETQTMAVDLSGQVALVTGGSRGIGYAAAEALIAAGAKVAITARTGVSEAAAALGPDVLGLVCDVADAAQAEATVAAVTKRFGKVSLLINNAGVIDPIGPLAESDPAAWAQNITINLTGAYHMARYALPGMIAAGNGVIVNVSSGAAHRPLEGWSGLLQRQSRHGHVHPRFASGRPVRQAFVTTALRPERSTPDMQVKIRASGMNPVSKIPRENLGGVAAPAACIAYLCSNAAADLAGEELAIQDASLRERVGLPPL